MWYRYYEDIWWIPSKRSDNYHRIAVGQQILELIQEALILNKPSIDIIEFSNANSRGFSHIGILVPQALSQWFAQVLRDLINPDASHCAHSQCPNQWIWILAVLRNKNVQARDSSLLTVMTNYFMFDPLFCIESFFF